MKLVIMIPCKNEQDNISEVLEGIKKIKKNKRAIRGVDEIKVVVLDDNSCDDTVKIAQNYDVEVISFNHHQGLSNTFKYGVNYALLNNADILVNLDGDNQYNIDYIEKLIAPILDNSADMTVGARPIKKIKTFSIFKKTMQILGSFVVNLITKTDIKDAASGFRALNKEAMLNINLFNNFTYTLESIIQLNSKGLRIKSVEIDVNIQNKRKSRLFKSNFQYIFEQSKNIIRFFIIYSPKKFFNFLAGVFFIFALFLGLRFLYFYFNNDGTGHIQSLILCAIIFTLSFLCFSLAIIGDLLSINRKILEEMRYCLRQDKYKK